MPIPISTVEHRERAQAIEPAQVRTGASGHIRCVGTRDWAGVHVHGGVYCADLGLRIGIIGPPHSARRPSRYDGAVSPETSFSHALLTRRVVVKGAAWAVPVVAVSAAAPLAAASANPTAVTLTFNEPSYHADATTAISGVVVTAMAGGKTAKPDVTVSVMLPAGYLFADGTSTLSATTDGLGEVHLPTIVPPAAGSDAVTIVATADTASANATLSADPAAPGATGVQYSATVVGPNEARLTVENLGRTPYTALFFVDHAPVKYPLKSTPFLANGDSGKVGIYNKKVTARVAAGTLTIPAGGSVDIVITNVVFAGDEPADGARTAFTQVDAALKEGSATLTLRSGASSSAATSVAVAEGASNTLPLWSTPGTVIASAQ